MRHSSEAAVSSKSGIVFSVVVPVFNEVDIISELYRRLSAVLEQMGQPWEIVLVDDGSRDGSTEQMLELAAHDERVRPVIFSRNFGHQIAITAGLDYARGEAVVIMDADLQDPPEIIPELVAKWREGFEVVHAVRTEREGETAFKRVTASLFYRLINRITDVQIPLDAGDFRLLDRKAVDTLKGMRERHRFPRGMAAWIGFRQTTVPYRRAARFAGETKYPLRKMLRLALTAITGFSYFPLQIATYLGFICAGLSAIAIPVVVVLRLAGKQAFLGQASTLIAVLFLGGVQLICLGILGEYIGRLYDEVKGRPLYVVRRAPEDGKTKTDERGFVS
jgi:glycosyltransferase involved in cell wall biosynthesis